MRDHLSCSLNTLWRKVKIVQKEHYSSSYVRPCPDPGPFCYGAWLLPFQWNWDCIFSFNDLLDQADRSWLAVHEQLKLVPGQVSNKPAPLVHNSNTRLNQSAFTRTTSS